MQTTSNNKPQTTSNNKPQATATTANKKKVKEYPISNGISETLKGAPYLQYYRKKDQKFMKQDEFKAYINESCPLFNQTSRPSRVNICLRCWSFFLKTRPRNCKHVNRFLYKVHSLFGKYHAENDEEIQNTYFDNFMQIIIDPATQKVFSLLTDSDYIRRLPNGTYLFRTFGYTVNSDC